LNPSPSTRVKVADLAFGILRIGPEDIERHLPVNRNRLDAVDNGGARAF
jgi:hypothetical protein